MAELDTLLARPDLPEGAVTPWMLARYQLGDLPREQARRVAVELKTNAPLAARLDALKRADAAFDAAMPWQAVREGIAARARRLPPLPDAPVDRTTPSRAWPSRRRTWRAALWGLACGAAALIVAFLLPPADPGTTDGPGPSRYKTDATLQAFVLVEGHPQRLEAGAPLQAGDVIQFRVSSPHSFLALIGVDGTGVVSRYEPVGADVSAPFVPGNARPLADALELDDAPGPEVFLAFLSDEALLVEDLERAVHDVVTAGPGASRAVLLEDWAEAGLAPQVALFHVEKE